MLKRLIVLGVVVAALAVSAPTAQAAPITGGMSIVTSLFGSVFPISQTGLLLGDFPGATALDFSAPLSVPPPPGYAPAPTPGIAGGFLVSTGYGDLYSLIGSTGEILDFSFTGSAQVGYPLAPITDWQIIAGRGFALDLLNIGTWGVSTTLNGTSLQVSGNGTFRLPGYDPTVGTYSLTAQKEGASLSWSASEATAAPIPEPSSMMLLGAGLIGLAGAVRRRIKK